MLTPEQLSKRKEGIGGSDVAAICGLSKRKTPLDIYMDKLGLSEPSEENRFTYFGNVLEPIIRAEYEKKTGNLVSISTEQLNSRIYPWMISNIDGYLNCQGFDYNILTEFKTADAHTLNQWGEEGTDQIPDEYLFQCAHYAIVCSAERVDLAVLIGGNDFRIYTYNRNEKLENKIIKVEERFWHDHVLAKVPPEPVNSDDLLKLWPDSVSKQVVADSNILQKAYELSRLKQEISNLSKTEDAIKYEIQSFMKDSDTLVDENFNKLITYKSQTSKRVDITALREKHPDICKDFLKESSSRVFRLNKMEQ